MQISYLREYLELVGYMSYTKAAAHLSITQPALSKHVAQLEKEFSASFLDRSGQQISLTDQGRVFCVEAQKILEAYDQAKKNVENVKSGIRIGGRFEDPAISRFFNAVVCVLSHDGAVPLPVVRTASALPYEDLDRGIVDICIEAALLTNDFDKKVYGVQTVGFVPFCALLSKEHPLAVRERLSVTDLEGETVIHPVGEQSRTRGFNIVGEICERYGTKINKRIVYTRSVLDYPDIQINDEVFIMPQPVLTKHMFPLLDKEYVSKSFIEEDIRLPLQIVWRRDNKNPAVEKLVEAILDKIESIGEIAARSFAP